MPLLRVNLVLYMNCWIITLLFIVIDDGFVGKKRHYDAISQEAAWLS